MFLEIPTESDKDCLPSQTESESGIQSEVQAFSACIEFLDLLKNK